MKICRYCGTENGDGAQKCRGCGATEFNNKCPNCGTVFDSAFCPNCGVKAGTIPKICPECGETFFTNACPRCGHAPTRGIPRETQSNHQHQDVTVTHIVKEEKPKKKVTFGKVLLWLFFFPIMAIIAIWQSERLKTIWKVLLTILIVLGVLIYGINNEKTTSDAPAAGQTTAKSTTVPTAQNTETSSEKKTTSTTSIPMEYYTVVTVDDMVNDLSTNALKAQEKYKGQYLQITGRLSTIDSDGKYIALSPKGLSFTSVMCYVKNDMQKAQVANMSSDDVITLRGKCKDMGEVMGYRIDIDSIDGYDAVAELQFKTSTDGYILISADELVDIIKKNPLAAQKAFKGKKIAITGKLSTIDSDGKYICLDSSKDFDFTNIQCYIKSDEQKKKIMEKKKGDILTVKGRCKDVGEVMGYSVDIESIE